MKRDKQTASLFFKLFATGLLIAAILVPHNTEHNWISIAAAIGLLGSLLLFLIPMASWHAQSKQKEEKLLPDDPPMTDTETLLLRQISFQITEKLRSAYPNATWDFLKQPQANQLLSGSPFRIRTFETDGYNFAEVVLDPYGSLALTMLHMEPLLPPKQTPQKVMTDTTNKTESWYRLIAKPQLFRLIADLHARGYRQLTISDDGSIFIQNRTSAGPADVLEQFPARDCWNVLIELLTQDELTAQATEQGLLLSWMPQ